MLKLVDRRVLSDSFANTNENRVDVTYALHGKRERGS